MRDTIDRQAAIKAVCESGDAFEMIERLNSLPSVEPDIIRCKDCKHANSFYRCDYVNFLSVATDFCSRAERKESQ